MNKTVNERIKSIRKSLGLSQLKFATSLGLTQGGYSDIERGRNNLSGDIKIKLSTLYRVNIGFLEDGKGEMFNMPKEVKDPSLESDTKDKIIEMLNSERELYIKLIESKDKLIASLEQQIKKT